MAGPPTPGSFYIYVPTQGVPIVFAILFFASGALHVWQNNLKYRSWRIGFLLPWAALLFTAGYCLREYGHYHYDELDLFIASTVLLFVAPPVYNGANYFILGRLLYYLPYLSPIHPGRVWTTFVALDLIDGVIAGNGIALAANVKNSPERQNIGQILVKTSLFLLLSMFLAFMWLVYIFHRRAVAQNVFTYRVKVVTYALYTSSVLILIRHVYRVAAFFYPWDNYIHLQEWPFWVFEAVPMVINTYLLNVYPPAKYLPPNHKIYLAVDGKTELEGPGMVDKRHWLMATLDPFDISGLLTGSDNKNRFWLKDGVGGPKEGERAVPDVQPVAPLQQVQEVKV